MRPQRESAKVTELKEELKAARQKCRKYEENMAHASVMNRWNIGEYLHDNLAQKLQYAKILSSFLKEDVSADQSELSERCDEILQIIGESINEVRDLSHDIIPLEVETEGIFEAFQYLKEKVENYHGITCMLEVDEIIQKVYNRKIASNLYLIAQEAIKNAVIHGKAENVRIVLIEHNHQLYLHVKDDGKGFTPNQKTGIGLDIMKHRAREIGGTFRIRQAKKTVDFSTYVTCTVPMEILTGSESPASSKKDHPLSGDENAITGNKGTLSEDKGEHPNDNTFSGDDQDQPEPAL